VPFHIIKLILCVVFGDEMLLIKAPIKKLEDFETRQEWYCTFGMGAVLFGQGDEHPVHSSGLGTYEDLIGPGLCIFQDDADVR
jgi:hypothetical protein